MLPFWSDSFGNPHSNDHIVGWKAAEAVRESQTSVAALIGADPDEIVFTSGATEANNLALFGSRSTGHRHRGGGFWSAQSSTSAYWQRLGHWRNAKGSPVETIPVDRVQAS